MADKNNAYDRLKSKSGKKTDSLIDNLLSKEETYWAGAAGAAILFAGFIDGGISMALAYSAKKLYEQRNG